MAFFHCVTKGAIFIQLSAKLLLAISYSSGLHFFDEISNQPNPLVQRQYPRWCTFEGGAALESGVRTLLAELRAFQQLGSMSTD